MGGQFSARLNDDRLSVLLGEFLITVIALDGLLNGGGLIPRDIAGKVFAAFPGLVLVIGALGSFTHDGQFATFHALDLSDLFEELSGLESVHASNI